MWKFVATQQTFLIWTWFQQQNQVNIIESIDIVYAMDNDKPHI